MHDIPPVVSVIMNCYNGSQYLEEAIKSVLNQTFENWELVFWDNCSSDSSVSIVESFAENDIRIKIQRSNTHTSLGEARVRAVECAGGRYLAFLDVDDLWYPTKLQDQVDLMARCDSNVGLIYSNVELLKIEPSKTLSENKQTLRENLNPIFIKSGPSGRAFKWMLVECFVPLPSVLVTADAYNSVGGIDSTLEVAEDYDLFLKISEKFGVDYTEDVLSVYRIHSSSLSFDKYWKTFEESVLLIDKFSVGCNFIGFISRCSWRGRYLLASLRNRDWKKFKCLSINPVYIFGFILYVLFIKAFISLARQ